MATGSDAQDIQGVLAVAAASGVVYEPNLAALLEAHKNKQCQFCLTDAGFAADSNIVILVRAKFSTLAEPPT